MDLTKKFDVNYDYEISLLLTNSTETLIGGSAKVLERALKNIENPNLSVKDLDIYFRDQPLGSFAVDVFRSVSGSEQLQELTDKLYANLLDKNTNSRKVAETLNSLDVMFKIDKSYAVRVLARTVTKWYRAAADYYMNARHGLGLKHSERALLGEQFRDEVTALIETTFTALKKKKSPQGNAEIHKIIKYNCAKTGEFLDEYSRYLTYNKVFCIRCKLCDNYFLTTSWNTRYCADCKVLRKKNSKKIYTEKCSEGIYRERQRVKFRFENFIHKNKEWNMLSDTAKNEYKALRREFVTVSASMLSEYEQSGSAELEREIQLYLREVDSTRSTLESRVWNME